MDKEQIISNIKALPDRVLAVAAIELCRECLDRISDDQESKENALLVIRSVLATDEILK